MQHDQMQEKLIKRDEEMIPPQNDKTNENEEMDKFNFIATEATFCLDISCIHSNYTVS